jgi:RNA-binding protein YhbY
MIKRQQRLRIRRKFAKERPTILIGKNGATKEVVVEIKKQLKSSKVVKIRILKTALEQTTMKEITKELVDNTKSELIEARGHMLTLYKMRVASNE